MQSVSGYSVTLIVLLLLGGAATSDEISAEQSALEFQSTRFKAMINADMEALEGFLADDLTYAHTTGWTETKSEFMSTVESGKINYMGVTRRDAAVRIYDDVAVITGLADMRGAVDDREVSFTIRFLDVTKKVDDSWQLVAWQSVRIPDEEN